MYDVIIIGGGIAGAGIARDAALRGLRVALFEKNEFASGASGKSSRLIHGGLRYLEISWKALLGGHGREAWKNFHFVFTSLRESRILEHIAPGLVRPLPMVVPVLSNGSRGRAAVYSGVFLYFLLAALAGSARLPRLLLGKKAVSRQVPSLKLDRVLGGVLLWDRVTDDKGLVQATLASARRAGAEAFEHAEVTAFRFLSEKNCYETSVKKGTETKIYLSRKLVNASGPWVDKTRSLGGEVREEYLFPVAGSHVSFKIFLPVSVILEADDGRVFFVVNTGNVSRVGTTERVHRAPDTLQITEEEIDYLLSALKSYFPDAPGKNEILSTDSGIRPLACPLNAASPNAVSREHEVRIDENGVMHVLGVKLTDHRRGAEDITDRLMRLLGVPFKKSSTAKTPLI